MPSISPIIGVPCLLALRRADARRGLVLTCIGDRLGDALRRRRMRGQKIRRRRIDGVALLRLELGIALHRGEKTRRAVRIVAGARGDADADRVRFEFLLLREACELKFRFGKRQRPGFRIADHVVDDAADKIDLLLLLLAQLGMPRDDMAHLMGDHGSKLGVVVGERDEAARHIELAGRQRESIDRLRIEDGDLVMQVRLIRRGDQAFDHLLDHGLQPRVVIDTAISREDALMLAQHRRRHAGVGLLGRSRIPRQWHIGGRRRGASGKQERRERDARLAQPVTCDARSSRSHHVTQPIAQITRDPRSRSAPDASPRSTGCPACRALR